MTKNKALKLVLAVAVVGMLFSGYLSYSELVARECAAGDCSYAFGLPVCVYGFIMYTIVFVLCIVGLRARTEQEH
jgi:uncharacterized membrane protein